MKTENQKNTRLAQFKVLVDALKGSEKKALDEISEKYVALRQALRRNGAHQSKIGDLEIDESKEKSPVYRNTAENLERFELHDILVGTEYQLFPVKFDANEWVLFRINDSDAFLLENRCVHRGTSYSLNLASCSFYFVCACKNCFRHANADRMVAEVAKIAVAHGISNVVLRHCNGWPYSVAQKAGVELSEIESEKYRKIYLKTYEKLKELVA